MPKIQMRRGSASQWSSAGNPVLAPGEIGIDTDTWRFKIGDGVKSWDALGYGQGAYTQTPASLTIASGDFASSGTWNGLSAFTLALPDILPSHVTAQKAQTLSANPNINGTLFTGAQNVTVGGAVYGQTPGTFKNIYVSAAASAPSSPNTGDVWIAY
jgi:hypothetical protein